MNALMRHQTALMRLIRSLLVDSPQGLNEYELIQQLNVKHQLRLPLSEPLELFRSHFCLFNALYQLRDQLHDEQLGNLQIHTLKIRLLPYQAGSHELAEADPLRGYYLDLNQLNLTSEGDVEELLRCFYSGQPSQHEHLDALAVFELQASDTLCYKQIKQRYRQLVSTHHPDRGGCTARLQTINKAMDVLQRYY